MEEMCSKWKCKMCVCVCVYIFVLFCFSFIGSVNLYKSFDEHEWNKCAICDLCAQCSHDIQPQINEKIIINDAQKLSPRECNLFLEEIQASNAQFVLVESTRSVHIAQCAILTAVAKRSGRFVPFVHISSSEMMIVMLRETLAASPQLTISSNEMCS